MQQYSRGNNSAQANSLKDLLQNKIDDMEKQVLSRVNIEESKPGHRNESDQRNKVETTLSSLHDRISDLEKGASGFALRTGSPAEPAFISRLQTCFLFCFAELMCLIVNESLNLH